MAKYDPQRPKRTVAADQPAQVDALLDAREADSPVMDRVETAPPPSTGAVVAQPPAEEPIPVSAEVEAPETRSGDAVLPPSITSDSDVPVALPPKEGTVNRAVLGAAFATVLAALVLYLIGRRRRARD